MDKLKPYLLPGGAALLYLGWWLFAPKAGPEGASVDADAPAPAPVTGARGRATPPPAPPTASAATASPMPTDPAQQASAKERRASRDAMLLRIDAALDAREKASPPGEASEALGTLDKEYIRERVQEDLIPVAQECYESALEDQPDLAGKLVMEFSIAGDESVGGVVTESEVAEESDIQHPALRECMRESTFALTFPPPEGGGRVDVKYPMVFSPDDPDEG